MATMAERFTPIQPLTVDNLIRFWMKVDRKGPDDCWLWQASLFDKRYGRIMMSNIAYCAHRVSYYIATGKDPGPMLVCHTCNNTKCVNPHHLVLGTTSENQQQAYDEGRNFQEGSFNHQAKLTEEIVRDIRIELRTQSRAAIAKRRGVCVGTIHLIARGETWRYV